VIAGLVVLIWPFDSIVVLVIVTGVWLVVMGVVQTVQAFQIRQGRNSYDKQFSRIRSAQAGLSGPAIQPSEG